MRVGEPNPKTVSIFKFGTDGKLLPLFPNLFDDAITFEIGTKNEGKLLSLFPNILFDNATILEIGTTNVGKLRNIMFDNVNILKIRTKNDGKLRNVLFYKLKTFEIGFKNGGKFIYAQLFFIVLFDKMPLSLRFEIFNSGKLSLLNNTYFTFVSVCGIESLSRDITHFPRGALSVSRLFLKKKQFEFGTIDDCQLFDKRIFSNLISSEIGRVCIWEFYLRLFLVIIWLFAICDKTSVEADKFCDKLRVTVSKYLYISESEFAEASVTKLAGEKIIFFDAYNFQFAFILEKYNITVPLRAVFSYFDKSIITLLLVPSELLRLENSLKFYYNSKQTNEKFSNTIMNENP